MEMIYRIWGGWKRSDRKHVLAESLAQEGSSVWWAALFACTDEKGLPQWLTCCLFMVAPRDQLSPASPSVSAASFNPLRHWAFRKAPVTSLMQISISELAARKPYLQNKAPLHKSLNGLSLDSRWQFRFFSMSFQFLPSPVSKHFSCIPLENFLFLCFSHRFLPRAHIGNALSCLHALFQTSFLLSMTVHILSTWYILNWDITSEVHFLLLCS